ncbi:hypothetical protein KL918_003441 [Ogataea parapolymorpha]|nr:hypothetical protein KL918_003441 [Ogataea parapolymorpha]
MGVFRNILQLFQINYFRFNAQSVPVVFVCAPKTTQTDVRRALRRAGELPGARGGQPGHPRQQDDQYVHRLRDRVPYQHPRVQEKVLAGAQAVQRVRRVPQDPPAGNHPRGYPETAGQVASQLQQPVQRRLHRGAQTGPGAVPEHRGGPSAAADWQSDAHQIYPGREVEIGCG